jgi:hypothetical protein
MKSSPANLNLSSIRDNHKRGSAGQFLIESIKPQADLSVVSAYFTIYAYNQLKDQLDRINHLRFFMLRSGPEGLPAFMRKLFNRISHNLQPSSSPAWPSFPESVQVNIVLNPSKGA